MSEARAKRCAMERDNINAAPDWGYCTAQGLYYYGYKLHAVCRIRGVIHSYDMTAASVHDIHYLEDVHWEYHDCMMVGDKGYLCAEVQKDFFEPVNITHEVPYRLNQKNQRSADLSLQVVSQMHRNCIFSTQRQSHDDTKLCKAILRTFHSNEV